MTTKAALAALALAACGQPATPSAARAQASAAPGASAFAAEPDAQWRLPAQLREISGLAVSPDGRLFAHDDERAMIYEIDAARGAIVKSFAVGQPVETGDFEGLAIGRDGAFWLTTSAGRLYRFSEGADGASVTFERFNTGVRRNCDVEGLAIAPDGSLILACKEPEGRGVDRVVELHRWTPDGQALSLWRRLSAAALAAGAEEDNFRASSIDFDAGGAMVIISARDRALAELNADGDIVATRRLRGAHPQAEGAAILPNGALIIADEGGDGSALLSRYPAAQ